ncbi:MAG: hypothetical protein RIR70_1284 [Pseudomonadota bacterium]|jgi:dephospho-CoA kinase
MRGGRLSRFVVGLTGGIGSGKSSAAHAFAQFGAAVVDTDALSHALTGPHGAAMPAITREFGPQMINAEGALDRAAMREQVFSDPAARARLEAILHPLIQKAARAACEDAFASGAPYVVLMVPLLLETGSYDDVIDRIAVVDCPEALQIERVCARSGLTEARARSIMAAQLSRAERTARADDLIDNSRDLAYLHQSVAALHQKYLELAQRA